MREICDRKRSKNRHVLIKSVGSNIGQAATKTILKSMVLRLKAAIIEDVIVTLDAAHPIAPLV
jgi:hypothetical protein